MPRSLKKGPYVEESLLKKIQKQTKAGLRQAIKTWSRRSTIIPEIGRASCRERVSSPV